MSENLAPPDHELIQSAQKALANSPDRDRNNVAAAVRTADGRIFTAFNLFKGYWGGGYDAEVAAVAVGVAAVAPEEFIPELFVGVKFEADREHMSVVNSCGRCLQWMKDFYPDARCVTVEDDGSLTASTIQELLPHGYDSNRGPIA